MPPKLLTVYYLRKLINRYYYYYNSTLNYFLTQNFRTMRKGE